MCAASRDKKKRVDDGGGGRWERPEKRLSVVALSSLVSIHDADISILHIIIINNLKTQKVFWVARHAGVFVFVSSFIMILLIMSIS